MSLLAWIVLGLLAGFVVSKIFSSTGHGFVLDIVFGIVGAVAGGWLYTTFGRAGITGFSLFGLLIAAVGATLLLVVYHAVYRAR